MMNKSSRVFGEVYRVQHSFSSLQQDMERGAEDQLRREESDEFESSSEVRDHASQAMLSNQSFHAVNPGTGFSKSS